LHISTALQEGKKKLFISPIITDLPAARFEGYETDSVREELLHHRRYLQDERFEEYITSMFSRDMGKYDGLMSEHNFESGILSASSLNEYAKCPLRYLLSYQYQAEPLIIERDDDALEASDIGTIFHSIAEVFAKEVKAGKIILGNEATLSVKEHLQSIAQNVHQAYIQKHIVDEGKTPNIFHEIVLHDLLKGLFEEHHERGLLIRFLDYVYTNGKLEHFIKSEQRFMLDDNFTITTDQEAAMLKGFIDRIDLDTENKLLTVIDYKIGKYSKDKENRLLEEMVAHKQFQLPLYLLYASQAYADHTIDSYLLSLRDGKGTKAYAHMSTDEANGLLFDEAYAQGLKERIREIKVGIEEGNFGMSPSDANCEYCPHKRICHKDILTNKGMMNERGEDEAE
jgi:ATP-dependent helicase/DNAse subunit B